MKAETFSDQQRIHHEAWRQLKFSSNEKGRHGAIDYYHILPKNIWMENIWVDIRVELDKYLKKEKIQEHTGSHNLLSSWVVCANLYFPIRSNDTLKDLMAEFLRRKVDPLIQEVTEVELEYAFPAADPLHPSTLLGEMGGSRGSGQTSPDVAFIVKTKDGKGLVLTECKYTEHSFYSCSARSTEDKPNRVKNPNPDRCMTHIPANGYPNICHQTQWGRKYWSLLSLSGSGLSCLTRCPAATAGYQLFRQQALAEGIMQCGNYSMVASTVAFDERNTDLQQSLKSTGIANFQTDWGPLFTGKSIFRTWHHQEWVAFVRQNQVNGQFNHWLNYLEQRYEY